MFGKLDGIVSKFEEISHMINDPEIINQQDKWRKLMKEHSDLALSLKNIKNIKIHRRI